MAQVNQGGGAMRARKITPEQWLRIGLLLASLSAVLALTLARAPFFVGYITATIGFTLLLLGAAAWMGKHHPSWAPWTWTIPGYVQPLLQRFIPDDIFQKYQLWYFLQWVAVTCLTFTVMAIAVSFHIKARQRVPEPTPQAASTCSGTP